VGEDEIARRVSYGPKTMLAKRRDIVMTKDAMFDPKIIYRCSRC
jgi:hypothetical protein